MGPIKAIVKGSALYEAATGKLINDGFASQKDIEDYVKRHYIVLPVIDNKGTPWLVDDKPIYCLRGTQYETVSNEKVQLSRCPDCGGMGIRDEQATVDSDCIKCTGCGHEFDTRLEMMET